MELKYCIMKRYLEVESNLSVTPILHSTRKYFALTLSLLSPLSASLVGWLSTAV